MSIETYKKLSRPPKWALREIQAGRLKGRTDINPQWRYQAMTEQFGMCGIGWKYEIVRLWQEPGPDLQVFAFAEIKLYLRNEEQWSEPIPGIGGHMLIPKEKHGLYANDEAYKMAVTDALSTAMKMIGVASDIYAGAWDGSKYRNTDPPTDKKINESQYSQIINLINETGSDLDKFCKYMSVEKVENILVKDFNKALSALQAKQKGGQE